MKKADTYETARTCFAVAVCRRCLAATLSAQKVQITGAGATFPYPIYSKWFAEYNKLHPNVEINYQSLGSGARDSSSQQQDGLLRRNGRADDAGTTRRGAGQDSSLPDGAGR